MINKKILKISFACILGLVTLASCNTNNYDDGEWYGVGIDVGANSRTDFLVGEKPNPSMFSFTAYDEGDEVEVDPNDVKIEPNRSLTIDDKKLTFKWRKYSTTLDINVTNSLISECELLENAPFKYTEGEHTLNKKGTEPDLNSEDTSINTIDTTAAKVESRLNANGSYTGFLSNVSYGSNFSYTIDSENEGDEIYLYASVASDIYKWGKVAGKYTTATLNGSGAINLSKVINISNNGKNYDTKINADIAAIDITEEDISTIIKEIPEYENKNDKVYWNAVTHLSVRNFQRKWLGKVTLEKGTNNIKIDFNGEKIRGAGFAYAQLACGNWDNIEIRYVKKGEELQNKTLKFISYPKQDYLVGEKFSLQGASLYLEDETGLTADVDMSKVVISNQNSLTPSDKSIVLTYNGTKVTLPINVKSKIISELATNNSLFKYVEPVHDRNKKNEVVGSDSSEIDTRAAINKTSLDGTSFIENVSAYSKFQYTYESGQTKGKFDIYANVASSNYIGGDVSTIWPEAKNGFIGSKATDFTKFLTLKNNDTEYEVSSDAKIPETRLNSFMDPATIKQQEAIKKSAWGACTYFLLNNFRRVHLGTVDIVKGTNNIEIDVGYNSGPFGYAGSACGNWQNIEIIYVDENTDKSIKTIEMTTAPTKTQYKPGEKFDISGAEFVGYNIDGLLIEKIDNSKIEIIDNQALYTDTRIRLKYQNIEFYVDVTVNGTIKQALNTLKDMTIQYHENPNVTDKKANITGSNPNLYLEKVSDGSYFEYIVEADKEINATISAEIATNAYIYKTGEYKDYDTGIEGFTQSWIGSHDLDMSKIVTLTNTVNNETTTFETNKDAIAYGHIINAKDDLEASKKYDLTDKKKQWGMADDLCMRKFKELNLGEIKLSKGTNVIRISIKGYLKENGFAYNGYACGNWKSISIAFK